MTDADSIQWSDTDYTMKQFVAMVKNSLPVLVMTTTGQAGCDDTIHEVGAGEMYWVFGIQRQRRAVARTGNGKYLSVPIETPLRFQLIDSNGKSEKRTSSLAALVEMLQEGGREIDMIPEKNKNLSYNIGASTGSMQRFGKMTLIDTYEEKYLLAYTVHGGAMHSITVGIPVYMDITMDIAIGFKYGQREQFNDWFEEVSAIASRYVPTPIEMCKEVIMFTNIPADGNYEYICLKSTVNAGSKVNIRNKLIQISTNSATDNEYVKRDTPPLPKKMQAETLIQSGCSSNKCNKPGNRMTTLPLFPKNNQYEKINNRKRQKTPPEALPLYHPLIIEPADQGPPVPERQRRPGESPIKNPIPNSEESSKYVHIHVSNNNPHANSSSSLVLDQQINSESSSDVGSHYSVELIEKQIAELKSEKDFKIKSEAKGRPEFEYVYGHLQEGSGLCRYGNIRDVPSNMDTSRMTIDEVSHCLGLLKLDEYSDLLRSEDVDGSLLQQLSARALVDKFGFSDYDATKLLHFMNGWRPQ